jgi:hypothetical protein
MRILLVAALLIAGGSVHGEENAYYEFLHQQNLKKAAAAKERLILLKKQAEINLAIENKMAEYQKLACDKLGEAKVGMTPGEVLKSCWGKPNRVNKTTTADHTTEQWVYGSGYVHLSDGIVTAIQTSR